jgi:hypothetical protein
MWQDFYLIDLASQYAAVCEYTHGWTQADIIAWMKCFGEVISPDPKAFAPHYLFFSCTGLFAEFRFGKDGRLLVPKTAWRLRR